MTEGPIDLAAFCPPECPHGHVLRIGCDPLARFIGGRVAVSFVLCSCPAAVAKPGAAGHLEVACAGCRGERRETVWRDPKCSVVPDAP